jgi:mRNA-degrading endonuclease HigB of HigAB toxin-antitoxin module
MSPKRKATIELNNTINEEVEENAKMSPFTNIDIVQQIVSFVGGNQYRFVATINKDFKAAYMKQFPYNQKT